MWSVTIKQLLRVTWVRCGSLHITVQCALSDKWRISTCRSCFLRGSQVDIKTDKTQSISGHHDRAQRSHLSDNDSVISISSQRLFWFWGKCQPRSDHMMTAESCALMCRPSGAVWCSHQMGLLELRGWDIHSVQSSEDMRRMCTEPLRPHGGHLGQLFNFRAALTDLNSCCAVLPGCA